MTKKEVKNKSSNDETEKLRGAVLEWLENDKKNNKIIQKNQTKVTKGTRETSNNPKKVIKKPLLITIYSLIAIYLIVGAVIISTQSTSSVTAKITSIMPYPAAIVGTQVVSYSQWIQEIQTLSNFYQKEAALDPEIELPSYEDTKKHILNRLVENKLLKKLAASYNAHPTDQEVETQINALAQELGGAIAFENQLQELYNWTVKDFKQKIILPLLLKQKVEIAITADDRINKEARDRAQQILNLTATEDFGLLAEQHSQDVTALQKGDLGYFSRGEMVPEFEKVAFTLQVGEVSGLIETQFGFHIIKVTEQLKNDDGEIEQVRAQHILIRAKDIDQYLEELRQQTFIWTVVKI